jgi:hypothetical protein
MLVVDLRGLGYIAVWSDRVENISHVVVHRPGKVAKLRGRIYSFESVIVDITTPSNNQKLSLFNLYVARSRSSRHNMIRILRDFDERLFAQSLDPDLLTDDERLEGLDAETKVWWEALKGGGTAVTS